MGYQNQRDEFIATVTAEGMTVADARIILRHTTTIERLAEEECSDERAYQRIAREQARCPNCREKDAPKPAREVRCRECRAKNRIETVCKPLGIGVKFSGDPRGFCVKLMLKSGKFNSWGGASEGYGVPTRSR
jgi:hypothetical protein